MKCCKSYKRIHVVHCSLFVSTIFMSNKRASCQVEKLNLKHHVDSTLIKL